jgi:hypothetical protein
VIPLDQQDYIRYQQALKGNRVKGAELYRSLLENKTIAPVFAQSSAAAAATFTDSLKPVNQPLPKILAETEYLEPMMLAYVNAGMGTSYATLEQATEDSRFPEVFQGRDIGRLPFEVPELRKVLRNPKLAITYSRDDVPFSIAAYQSYVTSLGMTATTITLPNTYTWTWAGAYVPGRGWYVFGAYTDTWATTRTARVWRIKGTSAEAAFTGSDQQQYIAAGYHPVQDRIYAFRAATSSTSTGQAAKSVTPAETLYLDTFRINADGSLSRETSASIGTNITVYEMIFDARRGKFLCLGSAGSGTSTFSSQSLSNPRNYAVPAVMIGDRTSWSAQVKYSFNRSPNSYHIRRLALDRLTGKALVTLANNTTFIIHTDNSLKEVVVNSDTSFNTNFGNVNIPVGRNKWIVNYYASSSTSDMRPYLLEVNEDNTLKAFTRLMDSKLDSLCYDPLTRYTGLLAGNYYAFEILTRTLHYYVSSVVTGTTSRYIYTAPDAASTLALAAQTETADDLSPSDTGKLKIVKPAYWEV